jgi:undecaprenyl-diphosphatase
MTKINRSRTAAAICLSAAFVLWTVLVCTVDVREIGPEGSSVGFATLNGWFHRTTGVHLSLYNITDAISILPLAIIGGFGVLGLVQMIRRRSPLKVDRDILVLGGFYVIVLAVFFLFEMLDINYRPILIEGVLEASYPSSTTMLAISVLTTAALQFRRRIPNRPLRIGVVAATLALMVFMVVCRTISGVHWLSDIIGGGLFSAGMVLAYDALSAEG